jgi:membrane protease YdiL (CAAX protease family)
MTNNNPNRTVIIYGILLVIFSYFLTGIIVGYLSNSTKLSLDNTMLASRLILWFFLGLIFLYATQIERQPFVLWKTPRQSFGFKVLSVILIFAVLIVGQLLIALILKLMGVPNPSSKRLEQMIIVFKRNHFLLFFTAFTAGITEELIFRAYLIPRLQLLFKNNYLPVIISSVLFGLMHISYGTLMQVLGPIYIGLIFGIYYAKYRDIKMLIYCHFMWDFFALIIKTR